MAGDTGHLSAGQLKAQLHDSGEIALLDARGVHPVSTGHRR